MYSLFVVDLMHEVELGVWKNLMVHLLRILASEDVNLLHTLDQRQVKELPSPMVGIASDFLLFSFRLVPTFGRATIRHLSRNSSELKKMAALDYEDFLQVMY